MADLSDVIEPLFPYAGDAPDALLITAYREAARSFFTRTLAWRDDRTVTVGATTADYDIDVPTDAEAFDFFIPDNDDIALDKLTREQAFARSFPATGTVDAIRMGAMSAVVVMPDPGTDISATLTLRALLRPTRTAATIPDEYIDRFAEHIEYGALERILRTPNEEWTDYQAAGYYRQLFEDAMGEEEAKAATGHMRKVKQVVRYAGY